jgi:hypothetical protein
MTPPRFPASGWTRRAALLMVTVVTAAGVWLGVTASVEPGALSIQVSLPGRVALLALAAVIVWRGAARRAHPAAERGARRARDGPARPEPLLVRSGRTTHLVEVPDIRCITAQGQYARIWLPDGRLLSQYSMAEAEARLPNDEFVRVHRSSIVNLHAVRAIRSRGARDTEVVLEDGMVLSVARARRRTGAGRPRRPPGPASPRADGHGAAGLRPGGGGPVGGEPDGAGDVPGGAAAPSSLVTASSTPTDQPPARPDSFAAPSSEADSPIRVALASGVEARLIEAEADFWANDYGAMTTKLNELRQNVATYMTALVPHWPDVVAGTAFNVASLPALAVPANTAAARDMLFEERGFWLLLTGRRLGDLRRLVYQHGLSQADVYPAGLYHKGDNYGADVVFPLDFDEEGNNPNFQHSMCDVQAAGID